ncbi:MAG: exosortase C-terminal domain/associated protein EpsI [Candidatus Eisenbacteria bacterium]
MIRYGAILLLLGATAAYGWLNPPANLALGKGVLTRVPQSIGEWNGTELSFEDAVVEELRADDILIRRYERGEDVVWLCIVYHQNRRYGAHDPRLCYESQGYSIERERDGPIEDASSRPVPARWFVAEHARSPRLVAYWWSTTGLATTDPGAFRRQMALRGALDNRSWGAFVRVETPIRAGDEVGAAGRLAEFGARLSGVLPAVFADSLSPAPPAP